MNEGWGFIYNSKKWHYYVNGYSLCGRWMVIVGQKFEQGNDTSPDNCKACRKKLSAMKCEEVSS